ncbi:MAG: histidine phosphatase family protein [Brooklawnia sp.]|jgi:broad specificity phosphatase PhoE
MGEWQLLMVRHGESTANRDRLVLGRSLEVPLTEHGRQQATRAAEQVAGLVRGPVALISSDATRARQTAEVIAERLEVPVQLDAALREQYLGDLEGRPVGQLRPLPVPEGLHITEVSWGGGESIAEVHLRMERFVRGLAARDDLLGSLVLVSHGDALCVLQAVLDGRTHREVNWPADALGLAEVRELVLDL